MRTKRYIKKKKKRERFETTTCLFPSGYKNKSKMKVKKTKGHSDCFKYKNRLYR